MMALPLHEWRNIALRFDASTGQINTIELTGPEAFTRQFCCALAGCALPPRRRVGILTPNHFGRSVFEFGACDACVHHIILPFWWEQLEKCCRGWTLHPTYNDILYHLSNRTIPLDLVIDGVYQHPYIMEGI